jgi:Ni/Co efflux regulator RcnB
MIKKTLAVVLAVASVATTLPAYARDDHHDGHGPQGHHDRGHEMRREQFRHDQFRREQFRHDEYRGHRGPSVGYYGPPRGGAWARGQRLPPGYRDHYYVVNDWNSHRLYRPQPGYQWVQVGSQFMLVAIASGVIANIILNQ